MPFHPTNDVLFSALTEAVLGGRCVAIIGAGVSADDYPVWSELISILQDRCGLQSDDSATTDPLDVAEAAKEKDRLRYFSALDEIFSWKDNPKSAYRYHMLARIPFVSYITLNFDPLLLVTLDLHRDVTVSEYPTLKSQHVGSGELFYLHGRLGPDRPAAKSSIVLTRTEFEEAYDPYKRRLHSFLQSTFLDYNVCFVGCDPTEPHVRHLLTACEVFCESEHGLEDDARPRWFLLWDSEAEPPSAANKCGIHLVRYPKGDNGFGAFDRVLEYWAKKNEPVFRKAGVDKSPYRPDVEPER